MVGRKCNGSILLGMARRVVRSFSTKNAEIFALFTTVKETMSCGFHLLEFELNCIKIVNLLNFLKFPFNESSKIVEDIRTLARYYEFVFIFTLRSV